MQVMLYFGVAALISTAIIYAYTRCIRSITLVVNCSMVATRVGGVARLRARSVFHPCSLPGVCHRRIPWRTEDERHRAGRWPRPPSIFGSATPSHLFLAGLTVLLADMLGFAVLMLIDTPMIQDLAITASIGVDTQGATDPATCRAPSDRNLQECAGVYRQGGCLDCHHAGCRHGHLGAIKFQVGMGIQLTFMVIWNMIGALLLIPALSHFLLKKAP